MYRRIEFNNNQQCSCSSYVDEEVKCGPLSLFFMICDKKQESYFKGRETLDDVVMYCTSSSCGAVGLSSTTKTKYLHTSAHKRTSASDYEDDL